MDFVSKMGQYLKLFRINEWIKNGFVFAGLIFAARLTDVTSCRNAVIAFGLFCLLSATVYAFNDLIDREEDKQHPIKRLRPIAAGLISPRSVVTLLVVLLPVTLLLCGIFNYTFLLCALLYVALNIAYTLYLKKIVIIDILVVASNYVIRIFAGALAIGVSITPYFGIAGSLLALFLALGKRRHELVMLGPDSKLHRATLNEYSTYFLDQLIGIVTASTVTIYSLYTFNEHTIGLLHTNLMPLTIPFVLYGVFRYLYLIHHKQSGGNPAQNLMSDFPLLIDVALWLVTIIGLILLGR